MQNKEICSEMQCANVCATGFVRSRNTITSPFVGFASCIARSIETSFDSSRFSLSWSQSERSIGCRNRGRERGSISVVAWNEQFRMLRSTFEQFDRLNFGAQPFNDKRSRDTSSFQLEFDVDRGSNVGSRRQSTFGSSPSHQLLPQTDEDLSWQRLCE